MALSQAKFKSSAAKIFANAKTGNLTKSVQFTKPGGTDPVTGAVTSGVSDTVDVVREEYKSNDIDGTMVKMGDYKLLVEFDSFNNINPEESGITASIGGVGVRLQNARNDFDVLWTLQMRKL